MNRLALRLCKKSIKKRPIIMIARNVIHWHLLQNIRNPARPIVYILLMLITRSKRNISAMQDKIRFFSLNHLGKFSIIIKKM